MSLDFYKEFGELGYLANYSNHGFKKDGVYYKTVEHYYQSKKFDNKELIEKIINCDTPKEASNIGRDRNNKRIDNFTDIKLDVMYEGVLEKFKQNSDIRTKLIETGNEEIREMTTKENYWGIGPNLDGENHIGKILMKVRDELRNDLLEEIIKEHPEIKYERKGFPNVGHRADKEKFGKAVSEIEEAWYYYDIGIRGEETSFKTVRLGSGDPLNYKPFPLAKKALTNVFENDLYCYAETSGCEKHCNEIVDYLIQEGYPEYLSYKNVIITNSTTNGFNLILRSIFRPYDVIIMSAPNYGLFAFMPERENIGVELVELKEENDYKISPKDLDKRIKEINKELEIKYKDKLDYIPRVRAFLNINPHNPLGTVLSEDDIDILNGLGEVASNNSIFIIDDLIYRDLSYDKIAKPIGTIHKYFDNTISLFGLSKSYGLARTRCGFVVANDIIIRLLRDQVFYTMDSASILQSSLVSGVYNSSIERNKVYKEYFGEIIPEYEFRCYLSIALFNGIESIKDTKYYSKVKDFILENTDDKNILEGIPGAKVVITPKSGFFLLIDFTELKNNGIINSEKDLLRLFYKNCGVKFLVGQSFSWPNKDDIIIRITYSFEPEFLLDAISNMNRVIREVL